MNSQHPAPAPFEQIEGETRAVDLVRAYLVGDVDGVAEAAAPGGSTTGAYMRQQLDRLLVDAVRADPWFDFSRPALMAPAGAAWLTTVPMSDPVSAAVWELASDGGDGPFRTLTEDDMITVLAISAAARGIGAWGLEGMLERLARVREVVAQP
ncbi:hypothetical protein ACSCBZ_46705 [Streptomyces niveiscabiei]|uniref:hypothetical protein n=2 Tax=Streptomyces niveiscabiei TaxID=164115 RepID=UPI003EB70587